MAVGTINLEDLDKLETRDCPGFNEALLGCLPGLGQHVCGLGIPGGFAERLRDGTYYGHVLEHVVIELYHQIGGQHNYGQTRMMGGGRYRVAFECDEETVVRPLFEQGIEIIDNLRVGRTVDANTISKKLKTQYLDVRPGPSTQALIDAATKRGISVTKGPGSLVRLGSGKFQHWVGATLTDRDGCISADIACDKSLTKEFLDMAGIPVPTGRVASTVDEAVDFLHTLGRPIVIKPCDGNQGRGVSLNLATDDDVKAAYTVARLYSDRIIAEEYIQGKHYRMVVVGDRLVATSERIPACVLGDGAHNVKELIDLVNSDPLRGEKHERPLTRIRVDDIVHLVLAKQNIALDDIPEDGKLVYLRENPNLSTGGVAYDVTDEVSTELAFQMIRAAKATGLSVAGLDLVTDNLSHPLERGTGAVIEINAAPGIRMHHFPSRGQTRDVAAAIVDHLFPAGEVADIPLFAVTGTNGKTTTARLMAHTLGLFYDRVGLAATDGISVNGQTALVGDTSGPFSARLLLNDRTIDAAVVEVARGGIIRGGLGYQAAAGALITNIAADHLGQDGVKSMEDLIKVKSLVAEAVQPEAPVALNALDSATPELMRRARGRVVLFSASPSPLVARWLGQGQSAVWADAGALWTGTGSQAEKLIDLADVPLTFGGRAAFNVENAAAAGALLWQAGIPIEVLRAGLTTFLPDARQNPGRQTRLKCRGVDVMLDYGHNAPALTALLDLLRTVCRGRIIGVIASPGDRDDEAIRLLGSVCGRGMNEIYIKEDHDRRGRDPGVVAALLAEGARSAGAPDTLVHQMLEEREALDKALDSAGDGDLLLVLYEKFELTLENLRTLDEIIPAAAAGLLS
jgi:cyanophycin synthetase